MSKWAESFFEGVDTFFAWLGTSLRQSTASYCELETADSPTVLVNHDGTLLSVLQIDGVKALMGNDEFAKVVEGLTNTLRSPMSRAGHALQVYFEHDKYHIQDIIKKTYAPAEATASRLGLELKDLFEERKNFLSQYCAGEKVYFVLMTRPFSLPQDQLKAANKVKLKMLKEKKLCLFVIHKQYMQQYLSYVIRMKHMFAL